MNVLTQITAAFYLNARDKPRKRISPYVITLTSFSFLLWMNISSLILLAGFREFIFQPLVAIVLLLLGFPVMFLIIGSREKLDAVTLSDDERSKGKQWIFIWMIVSIILMVVSAEMTKP